VSKSGTTTPGHNEQDERGAVLAAEYDERAREREGGGGAGRARRASKDFALGIIPRPRFLG